MKRICSYAIVTGASMGLGKSLAIELASRGRNMIIVSLKNEGLPELASKMKRTFGVDVIAWETDLSKASCVDEFAGWVNSHYAVDVLVNNAGIGGTA
ncbi:MAG TPA: SDR family NAD(P)-dependent oxidoreductase, partial [Prolixibacteraceae bacterium]|nr:SDR family NAD(P)-dependent oxidoreductase [Prolixibacteraceae bacterium]